MTANPAIRELEMYLRLERVAARKNLERAERAEAERDALRAQLDNMTTERANVPRFVEDTNKPGSDEVVPRRRGHFEFVLSKRLVGPWVEVSD